MTHADVCSSKVKVTLRGQRSKFGTDFCASPELCHSLMDLHITVNHHETICHTQDSGP